MGFGSDVGFGGAAAGLVATAGGLTFVAEAAARWGIDTLATGALLVTALAAMGGLGATVATGNEGVGASSGLILGCASAARSGG